MEINLKFTIIISYNNSIINLKDLSCYQVMHKERMKLLIFPIFFFNLKKNVKN